MLFGVSLFLGHHWAIQDTWLAEAHQMSVDVFWTIELIQAFVVVVVCTMPDLLLRQLSLLMASSRVLSLVVTLALVITVGLYMLSLSLLSDVLILGVSHTFGSVGSHQDQSGTSSPDHSFLVGSDCDQRDLDWSRPSQSGLR